MRNRILLVTALLAGCGGGASSLMAPSSSALAHAGHVSRNTVGLGNVLTSNGGEIYGYDVDQNGSDGVLATATNVETFDTSSGKITATFPAKNPPNVSYKTDGIFDGDVALMTRYVIPKGKLYAKRFYDVLNPVTAMKFTGKWTPPIKDVDVLQAGVNKATSTSALYAIELKKQDNPDIIVTDVGANKLLKLIHLDPNTFCGCNAPQFGQDYTTNQAVIAMSPDGGRVGGSAPVNVLVDLKTGKEKQWNGLNNGPFGSGYVNGLAVDSNTGIAATTTELNAQVEFYNLAQQTATFAQLPCTGPSSQYNSAWGIASDPVNGLFLVSDNNYCSGSQGSAIVVYDESGNLVETITGFHFPIGVGAAALDPSKRMGWAVGPTLSQLQQFYY